MKSVTYILVFILLLKIDTISAAIITVASGSSIQAAVDSAVDGDTIKVAAGIFNESITINQKSIILEGGYSNDFAIQNRNLYITIINSIDSNTVAVMITSCVYTTVDSFTIRNGRRGIEMNDVLWPIVSDNITISNNIIENNGSTTEQHFRGGGIKVIGSNVFIQNNIIRNNDAMRGGGIAIDGIENFILDANTIEDNIGHSDHGGGIIMYGTGLVSNNMIRRNRVGESLGYGWGGGAHAYNYDHQVIHFNHNIWADNYAATIGGAMIIDEGCVAYLDNELFYNNVTTENRGSQLHIDDYNGAGSESVAEITNSTFFGIGCIYVDNSIVTIKNSIVWSPDSNSNTDSNPSNDDFYVIDNGSAFNISYSSFQDPDYINTGIGNSNFDPLFTNPNSGDFHLQSTFGHWDSANWIIDSQDSPAIDTGDPSSVFNLEPNSNGNRVNMGCYGNTIEASKSSNTLSIVNTDLIKVKIFPNPVKELLTINTGKDILKKVFIYGELGQKIMESTTKNINVSNLSSGMYFVEIRTKNRRKIIKKIVKY